MRLKKSMSILIAISMLVSNIPIVMAKEEAVKIPSRSIYTHKEIIGKDRYETGRKVLEESKRFKNIIVVNGSEEKLVDGLCASGLVEKLNATILPINPKKVDKKSMEYINKAENVYIIGENQAIPYSFEKSINKKVKVVRIGGKDRYETSEKIAKYIGSYDKAYLVNGAIGHPDAMSISSVAAKEKSPIILTKKDSSKADKKKGVEYTAIGGTSVISNSLVDKYSAKRIGGETRYETNRMVLNEYYPNSRVRYFTNGETLVDALSAASISKNDGITFINRYKNHDLLEDIDTVQVGGFHYDVVFVNKGTGTGGSGGTVVPSNHAPTEPTNVDVDVVFTDKKEIDGNIHYLVKINPIGATDPDGDKITYECKLEEVSKNLNDYYPVGKHTVKVRATDGRGGVSKWVDVEVNANQSPSKPTDAKVIIDFNDKKTIDGKIHYAGKLEASGSIDPDGDKITYECKLVEVSKNVEKDYYPVGNYTVKVRATDGRGGASDWVDGGVSANQNPSKPTGAKVTVNFNNVKEIDGKKHYEVTIEPTGSTDSDGDEITYECKLGEVSKKLNDYYPAGKYKVKVRATDSHGGASEWFEDVEINANQNPTKPTDAKIIIDFTDKQIINGKIHYAGRLEATDSTDPEKDHITYECKLGEVSKNVEKDYYPAGKYQVKVRAVDIYGGASDWVDVDVDANQAPTTPKVEGKVIYKDRKTIDGDKCYKVEITASSTDSEGSDVTYKYEYLGEDNKYHPIKEYYPEGTYTFKVTAIDSLGKVSESKPFNLTIKRPDSILVEGSDFNSKIKQMPEIANVTTVKFIEEDRDTYPDDAVELDEYGLVKGYIEGNELIILSDSVIYANKDCESMFEGLSNIIGIEFTNFNTKDVTNMKNMFKGCTNLLKVDLINGSSADKINMTNMFEDCTNLSSVTLKSLNAGAMYQMFKGCENLIIVDLSQINIGKVDDMTLMFKGCTSLTNVIMSGKLEALINMTNMFNGCTSLTNVNLSTCSSNNYIRMDDMFNGCTGLTSVDLGTLKSNSMVRMFSGCTSLQSIDIHTLDTSNVESMQGMFSGCTGLTTVNMTAASNFDNLGTMSNMFKGCEKLTTVELGNCSSTKEIIMDNMFDGCTSLTSVNLGKLKSKSMYQMFLGCKLLTSIDLKENNISQVENMRHMFSGCTGLTTVNIISEDGSIDFSNLETMSNMFIGCTSLTTINLSSCSSTKQINMDNMFDRCTSLTSANLGKLKSRAMYQMFINCEKLTTVDLSNFDASGVTYMQQMFINCSELTTLNPASPTNFGTPNCSKDRMFEGCGKLDESIKEAYLK